MDAEVVGGYGASALIISDDVDAEVGGGYGAIDFLRSDDVDSKGDGGYGERNYFRSDGGERRPGGGSGVGARNQSHSGMKWRWGYLLPYEVITARAEKEEGAALVVYACETARKAQGWMYVSLRIYSAAAARMRQVRRLAGGVPMGGDAGEAELERLSTAYRMGGDASEDIE